MSGDFYVYEHWRPDLDVCFYVGKGRGARAWKKGNRSTHHSRIVAKISALGMCIEVKLFASGLTEAEALNLEQERISFWRGVGVDLVNKTSGGDGLRSPSPDTIEKMRNASRSRWSDPANRKTASERARAQWSVPGFKEAFAAIFTGRPQSIETRSKRSLAMRGRVFSDEHKAALSKSQMGNTKGKGCRGRKTSDETRDKLRAAWVRRKLRALERV